MKVNAALLAAVATAVVGGAGLSLAQNQDQPAPAPAPAALAAAQNQTAPGPASPANTIETAQPPAEIAIPPAEEAPPEPPPAASPPPAAAASANAIANAVAEAPPAPPPPPKRPRYTTAVLQALDKVTAQTLRFEATVNEPVRYKDLVITVHACETQASDEPYAQTAAHMEVQYQPEVIGGRTAKVARQVYRGWMFGDAPGLHPFEHPIYDLWVIACKTPSAPAAPASPTPPAGANL